MVSKVCAIEVAKCTFALLFGIRRCEVLDGAVVHDYQVALWREEGRRSESEAEVTDG
jgi:hypothetical protein